MTKKNEETGPVNGPDLFDMFDTDASIEKQGVEIHLGEDWFTVARAGGANTGFAQYMSKRQKPYRQLIQRQELPEDLAHLMLAEGMAKHVIVGWGCEKLGNGKIFWPKTDQILDFTEQNVIRLLVRLPELTRYLMAQASDMSLFRKETAEIDAKN